MQDNIAFALFSLDTALAKALLSHYCATMAQVTGRPSDQILAEVLAERDRLVSAKQTALQQVEPPRQ